jgi:mRNA interferase RelE/StbE
VAYNLEIAPAAERQIAGLEKPLRARVLEKLDELERNPRPRGVEKLKGVEGLYRVRVGDYRLVYEIQDRILRVLVLRVAHRREVYR